MYDDFALPLEQNMELMAREYAKVKINAKEQIQQKDNTPSEDADTQKLNLAKKLNTLRDSMLKSDKQIKEIEKEKKAENEVKDRKTDINSVNNILTFENRVSNLLNCIIKNSNYTSNIENIKFISNLNKSNIKILQESYKIENTAVENELSAMTFSVCKSKLNQLYINLIIEYNLLSDSNNEIQKTLLNTLSSAQILNLIK